MNKQNETGKDLVYSQDKIIYTVMLLVVGIGVSLVIAGMNTDNIANVAVSLLMGFLIFLTYLRGEKWQAVGIFLMSVVVWFLFPPLLKATAAIAVVTGGILAIVWLKKPDKEMEKGINGKK